MTDYGKCRSCTDSLSTQQYVTGLRVVAEALYRRLITRERELATDPEYGYPVRDHLGEVTTDAARVEVENRIREQCLRDNRVTTVGVSVTETGDSADRTWTIEIRAYTSEGPFDLVLKVDAVTTTLLGVS